jgi:hypothetical protein
MKQTAAKTHMQAPSIKEMATAIRAIKNEMQGNGSVRSALKVLARGLNNAGKQAQKGRGRGFPKAPSPECRAQTNNAIQVLHGTCHTADTT